VTFPQSPLLQTGAFAVPQTTTPQAAVTSSFLAQLQMITPTSSQLVSPFTIGALVFETPARTTLPSPPVSSPLPTFTTPRADGLGQEDYYLRAITEQISSALASDTVPPAPEAITAPGTSTVAPPPPPGSCHQLGTSSATTPTMTMPPASQCDLRGLSLLRRQILPLRLRLSLFFGACCQMGR
jgi:hypothetical protein